MKTMTTGLIIMLLLAGGLLAQQSTDIKSAGMDLLGALNGDMEKFERGMRTLESLLEKQVAREDLITPQRGTLAANIKGATRAN